MNILKLSQERFDELVSTLEVGGVLAVPTDTIYGLAADALNPQAVQKIFEIKGRPEEKALPIFVGSVEEAEKLAEIDERRKKFLEKVWPGKVTCVLAAKKSGTVALRIPNHDFILKLLRGFGGPLTGTSANVSDKPGHTKISEVLSEWQTLNVDHQPDIIVDAGDLPESLPSTVVDLTLWPPEILRQGAVSEKELLSYIE